MAFRWLHTVDGIQLNRVQYSREQEGGTFAILSLAFAMQLLPWWPHITAQRALAVKIAHWTVELCWSRRWTLGHQVWYQVRTRPSDVIRQGSCEESWQCLYKSEGECDGERQERREGEAQKLGA